MSAARLAAWNFAALAGGPSPQRYRPSRHRRAGGVCMSGPGFLRCGTERLRRLPALGLRGEARDRRARHPCAFGAVCGGRVAAGLRRAPGPAPSGPGADGNLVGYAHDRRTGGRYLWSRGVLRRRLLGGLSRRLWKSERYDLHVWDAVGGIHGRLAQVRERAVRLVLEHQENYHSQWAALTSIAGKIGCTAETLRNFMCVGKGLTSPK